MIGNNLLSDDNNLVVVDVGASGGIDPRWSVFTSYYKGILFEPDPREYESLREKSRENLLVLNSALSDRSTELHFHLCRKQEVSSIYLPNEDFLKRFPFSERFDVIEDVLIEADSLSNQLKGTGIPEIDFIKIDTQGHELPILKGGIDYLSSTIGLEIEVEFSRIYEKQPLFPEVDDFIRAHGFELFDIKRCYWKRKGSINVESQTGQLVFGDALYFKTPEQVLLMDSLTTEKVIRSLCVYLAYGYLDLAQILLDKAHSQGLFENESYSQIRYLLSKCEMGKVRKLFKRVVDIFSDRHWSSGTDKTLGN